MRCDYVGIYMLFMRNLGVRLSQEAAMATFSPARPDLNAHQRALRLSTSEIVQQLVSLLGRKLTAYLGGVKDVRAVDRWAAGGEVYGDAEPRLRFAFQVAETWPTTVLSPAEYLTHLGED